MGSIGILERQNQLRVREYSEFNFTGDAEVESKDCSIFNTNIMNELANLEYKYIYRRYVYEVSKMWERKC